MQTLPVVEVQSAIQVRSLKEYGVQQLEDKITKLGFLPNFPILVTQNGKGFKLIDGNHRLEAARRCGLAEVPCLVVDQAEEADLLRLAIKSNEASESAILTTFVDQAELIWRLADQGMTQQQIADVLGWSRQGVSNYTALQNIDQRAWEIIATTFEDAAASSQDPVVAKNATVVAFTENLLRLILPLNPDQQYQLVSDLAAGNIQKGKFKNLAEAYRTQNDLIEYAQAKLSGLWEEFGAECESALRSGAYDRDQGRVKTDKLIDSVRDQWEKKTSIQLIHGDFYEEAAKIPDGCVDLIITDPPYNVSDQGRRFSLEGRRDRTSDLGEWDKFSKTEFLVLFSEWAKTFDRLLKPQGSGYVFTSHRYISHLEDALEGQGFKIRACLTWHKPNPGTQLVDTNWKSSTEYIVFFTKGESGHTFIYPGDTAEGHDFIECPICGGNERLKDAKQNTLHPTQKPEKVIRKLMEASSHRGDLVFDGFAGVGTVGKVAKDLGRKFIGIERDQAFYEAAIRRLA